MSSSERPFMHSVRYVAGLTAFWTVVGGGIGLGGDMLLDHDKVIGIEETDNYSTEHINTLEAELTSFERSTENFESRDRQLGAKFGQACVNAVLPYAHNGPIAKASEDTAVSDLLRTSDHPCGSEPTPVREAVVEVRDVKEGIASNKSFDYNAKAAKLEEAKRNHDRRAENKDIDTELMLVGLALGGLPALLSTVVSETEYSRRMKRVKNRHSTEFHEFGLRLIMDNLQRRRAGR